MTAYLDTSALLKLFVLEKGSDIVGEFVADHSVAASALTYVEARSAFARRAREVGSPNAELQHARRFFEGVWPSVSTVPVRDELLKCAADLCDAHRLRAGDAIQLASALSIRDSGTELTFVCSDAHLLAAARSEGFEVLDPEAAV